jgi:serine/threonine protein kinase
MAVRPLAMTAPRPAAPRALPIAFGGYRIHGVLGRGGMGVVYRAEDPATGVRIAIKTVRSPLDAELFGLRREIRALWRLRHPGVVRILGDGSFRGCPWFAMELLQGSTLRKLNNELWRQGQPARPAYDAQTTRVEDFTPSGRGLEAAPQRRDRSQPRPTAARGRLREVLRLMQRICGTLAYVHGAGLVHRDLKPTNVFLRADGSPVLVDFGLACRFPGARGREALEPGGVRVGTIHYMAPEQIRADPVDPRADLYSLGCLLYESITGRRPFEAATTDEVSDQQLALEPVPPSRLVADLPAGLEDVVLQLLAKDPRDRIGYAEEVSGALGRVLGDEPTRPRAGYFFRPGPAVERQPLIAELESAVCSAAAGRGRLMLLRGDRGMGKTFLLGEMVRRAGLRQVQVITGQCIPGALADVDGVELGCAPLHPFRNLLRTVADRARRGARTAADRLLGARAAVLAPYEPALRAFVRTRAAVDTPSPQAAIAALAETIEALAGQHPLVVAIDDLQWADALSLEFLAALDPVWLSRLPLLIVAAQRSESDRPELQALAERCPANVLTLAPVGEHAMKAMVGDLLALDEPPAALVQLLAAQARGSPARLVEALRMATARGTVVRRHGRWEMVVNTADVVAGLARGPRNDLGVDTILA